MQWAESSQRSIFSISKRSNTLGQLTLPAETACKDPTGSRNHISVLQNLLRQKALRAVCGFPVYPSQLCSVVFLADNFQAPFDVRQTFCDSWGNLQRGRKLLTQYPVFSPPVPSLLCSKVLVKKDLLHESNLQLILFQ